VQTLSRPYLSRVVLVASLPLFPVAAWSAPQESSHRIEVESIPLLLPPAAEAGPAADAGRRVELAAAPFVPVTVTEYEVLPDGRIVLRCRQSDRPNFQNRGQISIGFKELPR
jgi:hypothetical protein